MALPILAGYKINQEFAAGGMAKIYDAIQVSLNRPVAIKFLSKKLLSHSEAQALFERESLIIAQLNHPNIVQIIDKGISEESQPYFVMEKIKGIDLSLMLSDGEIPFSKKLDIAIQICKGLAYAHKNGVIHRDIKPSNIIIDQHSNAKILDFGIALDDSDRSDKLTAVLGTEGYVAPEQQENYANATVASDIYSVGALFYDLFGQKSASSKKVDSARLEQNLPETLKRLIAKCCHQQATKRFRSLTQVRDELLRISQGSHLGQTNIKRLQSENKDLASNFNLLDILSQTHNKKVYLFQKKSNKQLLVIRRSIDDTSGLKEAKLLCSLKHPNIINVLAAVKSNDNATIISEYLSGGSLSNQLIQDFDEYDFLKVASRISSAIDFAHQNKILHNNLSPNNILFDEKQNPKICDFGQKHSSNDNPEQARAYIPPGQQAFSEQYDIYCMGAIFFHMLYGTPPHSSSQPSQRKISFRLEKLIDNMLSINPQNRPNSAQEVYVELQRIANSEVNKPNRSKIGQENSSNSQSQKRKRRIAQPQKQDNSKWLAIALTVAILVIIILIIKDFVR